MKGSSLPRALLVVLAVALAARAGSCWRLAQWGPGGSIPNPDDYHTLAVRLVERGAFLDENLRPTAHREPLYPIALSLVYRVTGPSYRAAQALNCALGILSVLLVFLLARLIFGDRAALLAAAIAAVHPQLVYYCAQLRRESLLVFLAVWALWLALRAARRPSPKAFAGVGAAAALMPLTNSAFLPGALALAAGLWLAARRAGSRGRVETAAYLACLVAVYSLWPIRNFAVFGRVVQGITLGWAHMYVGFIVPNEAAGTPAEKDYILSDPVTTAAVTITDPLERDVLFRRAALRWIAEHPFGFAKLTAASAYKLWRPVPYERSYGHSWRLIKWASLLSDGWIIPLGLIGLLLAGRDRFPETDLLNLFVAATTLVFAVFWSVVRYRLPLMPVAIIYAAFSLDILLSKLKPR